MKKIFPFWIVFSGLILPFSATRANACPNGFVDAGGGYCRNIVCPNYGGCASNTNLEDAKKLRSMGWTCNTPQDPWGNMCGPQYGDKYLPKR